jgi:hypothetical protein
MKPRRRTTRHPQIHLPPLGADYALTLVDIFERAIAAIWRAHGDRMADLMQLRDANRAAPATEYVDDGDPNMPDDTPF